MKKIFCSILIISICFVFASCGIDNSYDADDSQDYNQSTSIYSDEYDEYREPQGNLSIEDATKNYMYIDGKEIYLPSFFRDFTAYGWSLIDDSDIQSHMACNYGNGQPDGNVLKFKGQPYKTIGSIALHNKSDETLEVEACIVSHVVLNAEEGTFVLPGNITERSTKNDIIAVFGTDVNNQYYKTVEINQDSIHYGFPYNNKMLRYDFYFDGETLKWVKVLNVTDAENFS